MKRRCEAMQQGLKKKREKKKRREAYEARKAEANENRKRLYHMEDKLKRRQGQILGEGEVRQSFTGTRVQKKKEDTHTVS